MQESNWIISIVIPFVTGVIGWLGGKRKRKADAAHTELENVQQAIKIWRGIAEDLSKKCTDLMHELEIQRDQNKQLVKDLEQLHRDNAELKSKIGRMEKQLKILNEKKL